MNSTTRWKGKRLRVVVLAASLPTASLRGRPTAPRWAKSEIATSRHPVRCPFLSSLPTFCFKLPVAHYSILVQRAWTVLRSWLSNRLGRTKRETNEGLDSICECICFFRLSLVENSSRYHKKRKLINGRLRGRKWIQFFTHPSLYHLAIFVLTLFLDNV